MESSVKAQKRTSGITSTSAAPPDRRPTDSFDAITDLFLGEVSSTKNDSAATNDPRISPPARHLSVAHTADSHDSEPTVPQGPVLIEGVACGHLGAAGNPWLMQYARQVAQAEDRPVGVLNIRDSGCAIDLLTPSASSPLSRLSSRLDDLPTPSDAIRASASQVFRWIVRLDPAHEARLGTGIDVDAVTLLSTSDAGGISATFRVIRTMFVAGFGRRDEPPGGVQHGVRIVVIGENEAASHAAAERVCSAASLLLGVPVNPAGRLSKIESSRPALNLCNSAQSIDPAALIAELRSALTHSARSDEAAHRQPNGSMRLYPAPEKSTAAASIPTITPSTPPISPSPPQPPSHTRSQEPSASDQLRARLRVPVVAMDSLDRHDAAEAASLRRLEGALMLAANVPGLRPVAARCPYAPDVGLALDRRGTLHLLLPVRDADSEFMSDLTRTRDWLRDHAELVRLTLPTGTVLDATAEPGLHVFVRSGRGVSRLLRAGVRVHVAVPGHGTDEFTSLRYVEIS